MATDPGRFSRTQGPKRVPVILTRDEWDDTFREAMKPTPTSPEWKTVGEIAFSLGRGCNWVRQRLAVEKAAGRIETRRDMRMAIDDQLRATNVYRIKSNGSK